MQIVILILTFLSVTLFVGFLGVHLAMAPRRAAIGRLLQKEPAGTLASIAATGLSRPRPAGLLGRLLPRRTAGRLGDLVTVGLKPDSPTAQMLLHAGFRSRNSLRWFLFARLFIALGFMMGALAAGKLSGQRPEVSLLWVSILGLAGHLLPKIFIRLKAARRKNRLRLSLPDALDLLVVCVEAGMGLNQAIVKVSDELQATHPEISLEFRLVNLEIAAGRSRSEALRSLGERTGEDDIISLAAMIIQTDKFGTSIARSLRVHSDSLRTERKQRAEEAAAKTTVKLIFPLLFCVFPALFVIVLGPAAIHLWKIYGENF